jgi:hypothetical protein
MHSNTRSAAHAVRVTRPSQASSRTLEAREGRMGSHAACGPASAPIPGAPRAGAVERAAPSTSTWPGSSSTTRSLTTSSNASVSSSRQNRRITPPSRAILTPAQASQTRPLYLSPARYFQLSSNRGALLPRRQTYHAHPLPRNVRPRKSSRSATRRPATLRPSRDESNPIRRTCGTPFSTSRNW